MGVFNPLAPRFGNRAAVRRARRSRKARLQVRHARCADCDVLTPTYRRLCSRCQDAASREAWWAEVDEVADRFERGAR